MLSSKPICKSKIVPGEHCKLCPIKASCNKTAADWKQMFVANEDKKRERLIEWCEKEYPRMMVG